MAHKGCSKLSNGLRTQGAQGQKRTTRKKLSQQWLWKKNARDIWFKWRMEIYARMAKRYRVANNNVTNDDPGIYILYYREHGLEHNFWHEGEHQKARSRARFLARGGAPKSTICGTKESTRPKSTIFGTKESTKKHDLEHGFWHEGEHQKARLLARRRAPDQKARFLARRRAPKSTI